MERIRAFRKPVVAGILISVMIATIAYATNLEVLSKNGQNTNPKFSNIVPEIAYAGEVPLNPGIAPIMILKGSDYDIGYQWYHQLALIYGPQVFKEMQEYVITKDEAASLIKYEYYIKTYAPEMLDIFDGMVDGATDVGMRLTHYQILARFCGYGDRYDGPSSFTGAGTVSAGYGSQTFSTVTRTGGASEDHCSAFAAWGISTKDGKFIASSSNDESDLTLPKTIFMVYPKTGNNFMMAPFGRFGGERDPPPKFGGVGMNNKGLVHLRECDAPCNPIEMWGYGLQDCIASMHTLRFANDANEAKAMQCAYPSANGYMGGLWADIYGNAWMIESRPDTPCPAIRTAGDYGETDFIYYTNNDICRELGDAPASESGIEEYDTYVEHGGWYAAESKTGWSSVTRNLELWNFLHNYQGLIDKDFIQMMWRFRGSPGQWGTDRLIYSGNKQIAIVQPDNGNEGIYYSCTQTAARGHDVANTFMPLVDATNTFYKVKLDADPESVVDVARKEAQIRIFTADNKLADLTVWEVPYAALQEIYNKAVVEYTRGIYYQTLAQKSNGNDVIYNWSIALRAFTRCQAFSQQIVDALVPPATTPTDLGLREWFGSWGEWASP